MLPRLLRGDPHPHPQRGDPLGAFDDWAARVTCPPLVGLVVGTKVREERRLGVERGVTRIARGGGGDVEGRR